MFKYLTFLVPVLRRVLQTNKFTSIGASLALIGVLLLLAGKLSGEHFLALLGASVTIIGYASKDGVRGDATVAREDVPQLPPLPPTGAAVLLLFSALLFSACSGFLSRQAPAVAQDAVSQALLASQLSYHVGSAYQPTVRELVAAPDSLDLPPAYAHVPEAPYLVAPPAHLSKRERRQFLRSQRRALREAARTVPAKVKLAKGAAYNAAPDGTAVAQKNIDAPVGLGPGAVATDNRAPEPSLLARAWSYCTKYGLVLLALAVFLLLGYLRLGPVGTGLRAASAAARGGLPLLLLLTSCATTTPSGPAYVQVVSEGRDYQGFSLAPTTCQQRPFIAKKRPQ